MKKTLEEKKRDKERKLYHETNLFVNEFNYIQLEVLQIVGEHKEEYLPEYIRQNDIDYNDFINDYSLEDDFENYCLENELNKGDESTLISFCESESSFDDYKNNRQEENYPMWNTCFEFKNSPSEEILQAALDAGFGIIEGFCDFNPILLVSGCGYSFYAQHWIPLFLNLPWNSNKAKYYKNTKYSHL